MDSCHKTFFDFEIFIQNMSQISNDTRANPLIVFVGLTDWSLTLITDHILAKTKTIFSVFGRWRSAPILRSICCIYASDCIPASHTPGSCRKAPKRNTRIRKTQCFWHPDGCDPSWYPMHLENIGRASLANLGSSSLIRGSLFRDTSL